MEDSHNSSNNSELEEESEEVSEYDTTDEEEDVEYRWSPSSSSVDDEEEELWYDELRKEIHEIYQSWNEDDDNEIIDWSRLELKLDVANKYNITDDEDDEDDKRFYFRMHQDAIPPPILSKLLQFSSNYAIHQEILEHDNRVWYYHEDEYSIAPTFFKVLKYIVKYPNSKYTLEHLQLIHKAYPGCMQDAVWSGDEAGTSMYPMYPMKPVALVVEEYDDTTYDLSHMSKLFSCLEWIVQADIFWWEIQYSHIHGTSGWYRISDFLCRIVLTHKNNRTSKRRLRKLILGQFQRIFTIYCKTFGMTRDAVMLGFLIDAPELLKYLLRKQIWLDDGQQQQGQSQESKVLKNQYYCHFFCTLLRSPSFGDQLSWIKILIQTKPDSLLEQTKQTNNNDDDNNKDGLYLFEIAAIENRSLNVIYTLLRHDPSVLKQRIDPYQCHGGDDCTTHTTPTNSIVANGTSNGLKRRRIVVSGSGSHRRSTKYDSTLPQNTNNKKLKRQPLPKNEDDVDGSSRPW